MTFYFSFKNSPYIISLEYLASFSMSISTSFLCPFDQFASLGKPADTVSFTRQRRVRALRNQVSSSVAKIMESSLNSRLQRTALWVVLHPAVLFTNHLTLRHSQGINALEKRSMNILVGNY